MNELPAFLAATMGDAFMYEAVMITLFVLLLNVRRSLWRSAESQV